MTHRIAVASKFEDARARAMLRSLRTLFPKSKLTSISITQLYTVDARISKQELKTAARALTHSVAERSTTTGTLPPDSFSYAMEIGFLPGVTDNVGRTAKETITDAIGRPFRKEENVYASTVYFLSGALSKRDIESIAKELHNPLIERATIHARGERMPIVAPRVTLHERLGADIVDLDVSDEELARIGKEGIANPDGSRRGPLALSLKAMKTIRAHFKKARRNPTDIELESLAQTWSEHCKHSIFADPLDDVREGIYKRYIKGATERIRKQKGAKDFCVSVFKDNSGGIAFDDRYVVTHKVETHNSPSALDPFGGAITGIVGVNRDSLGFGLGAKPIANVYGFCVADPRDATPYYRDQKRKQPLLPARRILEGVIKGINHGGNQSGIPTPLGFVATDPRYRGKPLVFAGTVGLIPRSNKGRKLYEKKARPGDYIVMAGGRVGLDGIHGATFSSESLSSGSPATAVQIGDPITQKKLSDAIVREARDAALYTSVTDNGAGGISCSVAEMAKECGGCIVDIEKVPLKYPGLAPWQIWISESQERMTFSVPKSKWSALKKLFDRHDVEATVIGQFTKSKTCIVRHKGKRIMDMDMRFLHDGRPVEEQKSRKIVRRHTEPSYARRSIGIARAVTDLLSQPNLASTGFIARQYDHEVQATSVTKPLQGKGAVVADSGVLKPLSDSEKGVVLSHGYLPWYSDIDTYAMTAASIDTAIRNAIAAGASLDMLAILDNFCWSSSNTPERLYELKRSAEAVYDIAVEYGTPYISGKDSMFNDFRGFDRRGEKIHIAAPPTLLISAIGVIDRVANATTLDFKMPGDLVYVVGETNDELGASEYFSMLGSIGNTVPRVRAKQNAKAYRALSKAIREGLVGSALGIGRGGLGVALARASIAGMIGADISIEQLAGHAKRTDSRLFSESQGRIMVSVRPTAARAFEQLMSGVALSYLGVVGGDALVIEHRKERASIPVQKLKTAYIRTFGNW